MKIGGGFESTSYVYLPVEVVEFVIIQLSEDQASQTRQSDLWACCLVCKLWYSTAIAYLYEQPQLYNQNFDKFCRTICPPVSSHVRRMGLENFIKSVDMGRLAYESSNSLTARLLRRTGLSLETFIAPSVSFSVACLAPLSKCQNLQMLDLSQHFRDLDLQQLLLAIGDLKSLQTISLPKSAFQEPFKAKPRSNGSSQWPPNLMELQINSKLPLGRQSWEELICSWPPRLDSLRFDQCLRLNPLGWLGDINDMKVYDNKVTSIDVTSLHREDSMPLQGLVYRFRRLKRLTIPVSAVPSNDGFVSTWPRNGPSLEQLKLTNDVHDSKPISFPSLSTLRWCIVTFTRLWWVQMPKSSLLLDRIDYVQLLTQ